MGSTTIKPSVDGDAAAVPAEVALSARRAEVRRLPAPLPFLGGLLALYLIAPFFAG